jgi:hypothetical protein
MTLGTKAKWCGKMVPDDQRLPPLATARQLRKSGDG